jgi:hypothetical protein
MSGKQAMLVLARKLRAKAKWDYVDGWYSTDADQARNSAKREAFEDFAQLLDETFDFDSSLNMPRDRKIEILANTTNVESWVKNGE